MISNYMVENLVLLGNGRANNKSCQRPTNLLHPFLENTEIWKGATVFPAPSPRVMRRPTARLVRLQQGERPRSTLRVGGTGWGAACRGCKIASSLICSLRVSTICSSTQVKLCQTYLP